MVGIWVKGVVNLLGWLTVRIWFTANSGSDPERPNHPLMCLLSAVIKQQQTCLISSYSNGVKRAGGTRAGGEKNRVRLSCREVPMDCTDNISVNIGRIY